MSQFDIPEHLLRRAQKARETVAGDQPKPKYQEVFKEAELDLKAAVQLLISGVTKALDAVVALADEQKARDGKP